MQVKIHDSASKEFDDAIDWYNLQLSGLGTKFRNSVIKQINKIRKHPNWYPIEAESIFKAYVPKFPFKILFTIEESELIVIWAIAHLHRKPWFWQKRIN